MALGPMSLQLLGLCGRRYYGRREGPGIKKNRRFVLKQSMFLRGPRRSTNSEACIEVALGLAGNIFLRLERICLAAFLVSFTASRRSPALPLPL
jgi:hypothetical protein